MSTDRIVHMVDDDPDICRALCMMLAAARIETRVYGTAETYLEGTSGREAACVLLDNRLPGMSGLDLLQRLTEAQVGAAVIMMTGHGDIATAVAAMKGGAFHFVEKPFDSPELLAAVEEALARAAAIQDRNEEMRVVKAYRDQLTPREAEVLEVLLEGMSSKGIAARLGITLRTAEHHRAAILKKFNASSISHVMRMVLGANNRE